MTNTTNVLDFNLAHAKTQMNSETDYMTEIERCIDEEDEENLSNVFDRLIEDSEQTNEVLMKVIDFMNSSLTKIEQSNLKINNLLKSVDDNLLAIEQELDEET